MANENATKIQLRHDSSANWFANNPILAQLRTRNVIE